MQDFSGFSSDQRVVAVVTWCSAVNSMTQKPYLLQAEILSPEPPEESHTIRIRSLKVCLLTAMAMMVRAALLRQRTGLT
jgi:hypothetical protein